MTGHSPIYRRLRVLDSQMAYQEMGQGDPIVFIHGNPTSSYLWRNVLPLLSHCGRLIAIDLIGMGQSGKPDIVYSLQEHIDYVEEFLERMQLRNITLVLHDWGCAIGFHIAHRFPERIKAITFMEGHIKPIEGWSHFDEGAREMFKALRSSPSGEKMILDDNFFIEAVIPGGTQRSLSAEEMHHYRMPFIEREYRVPMLAWVRQIPIEGEPAQAYKIVSKLSEKLSNLTLPVLLIYSQKGSIISDPEVDWCKSVFQNLELCKLDRGYHFLPEDEPLAIGEAIADWLERLEIMTEHVIDESRVSG